MPLLNFLSGLDDGVGGLRVHQAEFAIGFGRGFLHHGDGANKRGVGAESADGKVLHRASGLDTVVDIGGNFFEAERVFFGTGGHEAPPAER